MRPALVLFGAVAILGLSHLLQSRGEDPAPTAVTTPPVAPIVQGSPARRQPPKPAFEDELKSATRTVHAPATAAARAFLSAYLRWQDGRASANVAETLRSYADPRLWALLRGNRGAPRPPTTMTRKQLRRLAAGSVSGPRAAKLLAVLRSARARSALALVLRRRNGQWRVTELGK
jgi:hypothetical protein